MKPVLVYSLLSFLAGSTAALPAETPSSLEARWEHGTCSVHLDIEYSYDDNTPWEVKAQVYDNANALTGNVTFPMTLIGGVYGARDVGLDEPLYLLSWRNHTENVSLMQYGRLVIQTGPFGTENDICKNGELVDGYKIQTDCIFAC